MVNRLEAIRWFVAGLELAGLTPFDLCSWTTLLHLTDRCDDLNVASDVHDALEAAVQTKAADLDAENMSDFYRGILGKNS